MTAEQPIDSLAGQPAVGSPQRQLLSQILSSALRLWLKSQVEAVEALQLQIQGGDRQILSGHIPQVTLAADHAVYQGFHLSHIQLAAAGIRLNLGQILRGKPLRLLAVVPVAGEVLLRQIDVTASLQSSELAQAVTDWLLSILQSQLAGALPIDLSNSTVQAPTIQLEPAQLVIGAQLVNTDGSGIPLAIRTGLQAQGSRLRLERPQWLPHAQAKRGLPLSELHGFEIELGAEVDLQELILEAGQVRCRGRINVIP